MSLGGCAVGPDFERPAPPSVARYTADDTATAPATGVRIGPQEFVTARHIESHWYRRFHSTALDSLVQRALANNPSAHQAQARLIQARDLRRAAAGGLLPQASAGATARRNRTTGATIGLGNPMFSNTFNFYRGQIRLTYALDVFGGVRRQIESASAQVAFRRYQLLGMYLELVNNVVTTAIAEAGTHAAIGAVKQIIQAQRRQLQLAKSRHRHGAVAGIAVARAQSQLAQTQTRLPPLLQQQDVLRHQLAVLVGVPPARFQAPDLTVDALRLPRQLPVTLPARLVRQRPDILAAESLLHAASARIGVATARLYPGVNLIGAYGRQGLDVTSLSDPVTAIWQYGVSLTTPIFQGGTLRARRDASVAAFEAARASYRAQVISALGEVADALRALEHGADTIDRRRIAMNAAARTRRLTIRRFKRGAADAVAVSLTEQQYAAARLAYVRARVQRLQHTVDLFRVLGGGWVETQPTSVPAGSVGAHSGPAS